MNCTEYSEAATIYRSGRLGRYFPKEFNCATSSDGRRIFILGNRVHGAWLSFGHALETRRNRCTLLVWCARHTFA